MRRIMTAVILTMIAWALGGCGFYYSLFTSQTPVPLPTSPAQVLPVLIGDWHITVNKSGGIMGISRTMEISGNGVMTITDAHVTKPIVITLPVDRLTELGRLVETSRYQPPSKPSGCADCFIYTLVIASDGQNFHAQLDDLSITDSGLEPLISFIVGYLDNNG